MGATTITATPNHGEYDFANYGLIVFPFLDLSATPLRIHTLDSGSYSLGRHRLSSVWRHFLPTLAPQMEGRETTPRDTYGQRFFRCAHQINLKYRTKEKEHLCVQTTESSSLSRARFRSSSRLLSLRTRGES